MKAKLILSTCALVALGAIVLPLAASLDETDATVTVVEEEVAAEEVAAEEIAAADIAVGETDAVVASQPAVAAEVTDDSRTENVAWRFKDDPQITPEAVSNLLKRFPRLDVVIRIDEGNRVLMSGRKEAVETVITLLRSEAPQKADDATADEARVKELVDAYRKASQDQVAAAERLRQGQNPDDLDLAVPDPGAIEVNAVLKATIAELLAKQRADERRYRQALAAHRESEAALNDRASVGVSRDELLKLVQSGFTARQELHSLEILRLKERVQALEQRLEQRETLRERIINQRVEEMLKGTERVTSGLQELEIKVDVVNDSSSDTPDAVGAAESAPLLQAGDTLGVYIPHVIPRQDESPPVFVVGDTGTPAMGYPLTIREDGTLSLPLIPPLKLAGTTLAQAEGLIRDAFAADDILKAESAIVMLSMIRRAGDSSPIRQLSGDSRATRADTSQQAWSEELPATAFEWDRGSRTVAPHQDWPHFGDDQIRLSLEHLSWKDALQLLADKLDVSLDYKTLPEGSVTIDTGEISPTAALDLFERRLNAEGFALQVTHELMNVARRPASTTPDQTVRPRQNVGPPVIVQAAMEKSPTQYFDALWQAYRRKNEPSASGHPAPESATRRYELLLREYSTQLHILRSNLDLAKTEYSDAEAEYAYGKALQKQGNNISEREVDALRTRLATAESKVEQAALLFELYESAWDEAKAAKEVRSAVEADDSAAPIDSNSDPAAAAKPK